ncbi:MAG: RNA recognition motif domain-containing protein [Polyangiaceae bacterium]
MANEEAKLFVAGLPDSVSEEVLKQLFEATGGKVISVSLPKDRMTGRPRGFGFVTLATPQDAETARQALDGSMQAGRSISVRPFQAEPPRRDALGGGAPRAAGAAGGGGSGGPPQGLRGPAGAQAPDRTLYIGNLPYDATVEEVQGLINEVVPDGVVRVHLPMDADGRKRGFGFVTMASTEAAKSAEAGLRSADLRARRLVVNLAHPKGERPARSDAGGGGFSPSFTPSFGGGGGPSGPQHRKVAPHEERRKRSFEDGGGPRKKRPERGGGGAGKVVDYGDDDEK